MFYGGRLFSHLTALDTDKSHYRARISSTKQRLKNEFNSGNGFAWVTKGREVENYLNYGRIEASVLAVHPSAGRLANKGQWDNLLKYYKNKGRIGITANKVKVARHYVDNNKPDFTVLDLNELIEQLCKFISGVNN